ncbi:MAG: hypothetical protein AB2448_01820 [Moorella sp. (in: firmicutes)]
MIKLSSMGSIDGRATGILDVGGREVPFWWDAVNQAWVIDTQNLGKAKRVGRNTAYFVEVGITDDDIFRFLEEKI